MTQLLDLCDVIRNCDTDENEKQKRSKLSGKVHNLVTEILNTVMTIIIGTCLILPICDFLQYCPQKTYY